MTRQKPRRVIQIERLEDRHLLAGTADIVLIIDDSQTMTDGGPNASRPVLDFVTDKFLPALDLKLAEYEIGTEEPNHFGLVTFGGGMTPAPGSELFDDLYQKWGPLGSGNGHPTPRPIPLDPSAGEWDATDPTPDHEQAEALKRVYLAPIQIQTDDPLVPGLAGKTTGGQPAGIINNLPETSGISEDSWQAVDYVCTVEYHLENGVNDDPIFDSAPVQWRPTGPLYDFRDDAIVHFILISETGRVRHYGDYPMLPWELVDPFTDQPPIGTEEEWDRWDNVNLHNLLLKLTRPDAPSENIDLTAFVPARFQPTQSILIDPDHPELGYHDVAIFASDVPILGVDVNVIEGWDNIESWDIDEHDPFGTVWLEPPDPLPEPAGNEDYVVFYAEGITGSDTGEIVETHIEGNLLDKNSEGDVVHNYRQIIEELSCWPEGEGQGTWSYINRDIYIDINEVFFDYEKVDQEQIDRADGGNGSGAHGVEEQAFLAWEARGTVWTSAYLGYDMYGGPGETGQLQYPPGFDLTLTGHPDYEENLEKYNALMDLLSNAMAQDVVNKITGPRVTGVEIIGPNDQDDGDGDGVGEYSIPVGNGDQLSTVPIGGANAIRITFSEDVKVNLEASHYWQLDQYDLTLVGTVNNTQYGSGNGFSYDPDTRTATWTFAEAFPADKMELTLSSFADRHRTWHDGDWINPGSIGPEETSDVFPSGDGSIGVGEEFVFHFTILPGDANRDNVVGLGDLTIMQANVGTGGRNFQQGDFNGDGDVDDAADYQILFKVNFGRIWVSWDDEYLLADIDQNGLINGLDVAPFVALITGDPDLIDIETADMNDDGAVNGLDVSPFIQAVLNGLQILLPSGI